MNRTREQLLPILCQWITFLAHALPLRSVPAIQSVLPILSEREQGSYLQAHLSRSPPPPPCHWVAVEEAGSNLDGGVG